MAMILRQWSLICCCLLRARLVPTSTDPASDSCHRDHPPSPPRPSNPSAGWMMKLFVLRFVARVRCLRCCVFALAFGRLDDDDGSLAASSTFSSAPASAPRAHAIVVDDDVFVFFAKRRGAVVAGITRVDDAMAVAV